MDNFGNKWDDLQIFLALIAIVNTLAIVYAIFITVYSFIKRLPTKGLETYWYLTLLILILDQFFSRKSGVHLYIFSSPILLLMLRFHKKISNAKWLKNSNPINIK